MGETFAGLPFEKGLQFVDMIKKDVLPHNLSMVELALRWILDHDAVSTIIPGASSVNQVKGNVAVSHLEKLSPSVHQKLKTLYASKIHSEIRGGY